MLNGSPNDTPASSRARLVAISPPAGAPAPEENGVAGAAGATPTQSAPERMQWLLIFGLTLLSALAGGAAAWLLR